MKGSVNAAAALAGGGHERQDLSAESLGDQGRHTESDDRLAGLHQRCGQRQIWCACAEVLLGEASFSKPIVAASGARVHSDSRQLNAKPDGRLTNGRVFFDDTCWRKDPFFGSDRFQAYR